MSNRIFVARLPWSICKVALKNHFSKFGPISDGYVVLDRVTRRSKGYGFVTFSSQESADQAVNSVHEMDGRQLVVNLAFDKDQNQFKQPTSNESQ